MNGGNSRRLTERGGILYRERRARRTFGIAAIPRRVRGDGGDTLIEVLIALIILALSVSAILGMLVTAITTTSEYRSLATDNTVLKSFAEAAKYEIQLGPHTTSSFANCATTYLLASNYPSSGPIGSTLTVFGTGFPSSAGVTVKLLGSTPTTTTPLTTLSVLTTARYPASFTASGKIPAGLTVTRTYSVSVSSGGKSVVTPTRFLVTSPTGSKGGTGVASVKLHLHVYWWGLANSTWTFLSSTTPPTTCNASAILSKSDIQELKITARTVNGVGDTVLLVVTNPVFP